MAYVKVATTKNCIAALRYGEHEKDCIKSGVDCPDNTAMAEKLFKADRVMWNKDSGVQAHIIIQSFEGKECTPGEANKMGQELARKVAPGHRAMVYTHTESEGGNIHNHIVISAVNHENGRKLDGHGFLYEARAKSNEITLEHGLSVIEPGRGCEFRYSMAEKAMEDKGVKTWKDEIRYHVENGLDKSRNEQEFKEYLKEHGISVNERERKKDGEKSWTYVDEEGHKVRAVKLGDTYSRDNVLQEMEKKKEISQEPRVSAMDRGNALIRSDIAQEQQKEQNRANTMEKAHNLIKSDLQSERAKEQEILHQQMLEKKKKPVKQVTKTREKTREISIDRGFSR